MFVSWKQEEALVCCKVTKLHYSRWKTGSRWINSLLLYPAAGPLRPTANPSYEWDAEISLFQMSDLQPTRRPTPSWAGAIILTICFSYYFFRTIGKFIKVVEFRQGVIYTGSQHGGFKSEQEKAVWGEWAYNVMRDGSPQPVIHAASEVKTDNIVKLSRRDIKHLVYYLLYTEQYGVTYTQSKCPA